MSQTGLNLSTRNTLALASDRLEQSVQGDLQLSNEERDSLLRQILNVPSRFPLYCAVFPPERGKALILYIQVGNYQVESLMVRYDRRNILVDGVATKREEMPELLKRKVEMYRRIESLFG